MENENMHEDENMELEAETAEDELTEASVDETEELSIDEQVEAPEEDTESIECTEASDIENTEDIESSEDSVETDENVDAEYADDEITGDEAADGEEFLDEEARLAALAAESAKKRANKTTLTVLGIVGAVVIALIVWCVLVVNGVGGKTAVNMPQKTDDETALKVSVKYENPIYTAFESLVFGDRDKTVAKVNGKSVDEAVFKYLTNTQALNLVYSMLQSGELESVKDFDWNKVDEKTGLTYNEYAKAKTVEAIAPIYAVLNEGEKNGVTISQDDEKQLNEWLDQLKSQYGSQFNTVLKQSGYDDEKTLVAVQKMQLLLKNVTEDIEADLSKYASDEQLKKYLTDDKVSVKHILIQFADETDEAKSAAKKKAEDILQKVKSGEDFDTLLKENSEDPGQPEEGYTFANDGTMVQEFTDAAFALEVGGISELVETSYGYHIIKRLERKATYEEYIAMLTDNAKVTLKKSAYDKIMVNINLEDFFGAGEADSGEATAE